MTDKPEGAGSRACWFVGATYGSDDQTSRFLNDGIWENGYQDKYLDQVKSIQTGDRIAIISSYTRKRDLSFDNRGQSVSVMGIKAIGVVKKNHGDGRTLDVEWTPFDPPREWYFYTNRSTVWRVLPGDWTTDALIGFTFEEKPQDISRFRNAPYWRERFGDTSVDKKRFLWTRFYEAIADKLLLYRDKRDELIKGIHSIASKVEGLSNLQDQFQDGSTGPLKDICPFTAMGIFNRGITDVNRKNIATELATFLGVEEVVPDSFEGIPILNNQNSWFFGFDNKRKSDDIDALWEIFARAITFSDSDDSDVRAGFISAYDSATERFGVGWNLTMGLYWIRPWNFPTLDGQSQRYISKILNIIIGLNGPIGRCNTNDYLAVLDTLKTRFQEEAYPVHSFPELSLAAWLFKDGGTSAHPNATDTDVQSDEPGSEPEEEVTIAPIEPYSVDNIISDGCFIERVKLERILERLRTKKNLILQGPPGTGKTWLAKRLALALIGQKNDSKVRAVQFHPNLSYEDFVRGWRPSGDGKLTLVDGPFVEMIRAAENEPSTRHVIVIEEINRGNPAQIFGEMLTLWEVDKRTPNEALELSYRREDDERVFIPDNLYVIGTMNIADRSLALVDLALRRRFAFIDLKPALGNTWKDWVATQCGIATDILDDIESKLLSLNTEITSDSSLGEQFSIGHSYVTPPLVFLSRMRGNGSDK
ncbi:McrB family protein [Kiritimatiella glycovorans]|uniref:5-methylcytosine-specific restriction enzyme B n=1 Tax=Kiritimatiella glycovorans TaxID=1307763 RepID=A0A0G3EII2_9BACT|nr:AAA family ATPase [Kiritimatiella glycovorans]AKJ63949.1 5-methylcytosine-specific restriction enzyme B [Kiritimatiella glycovorans]